MSNIKKQELDYGNRNGGINVKLEPNEELNVMVASGPYMATGSTQLDPLNSLVNAAKSKNVHVLILVSDRRSKNVSLKTSLTELLFVFFKLGPFVDSSHDLISTGNIQFSYDELLLNILENIAINLAG